MGRIPGLVMLTAVLLVSGCWGGSEGGSGNFDQARDARYLQQWCDTVVGAYPAMMAVAIEANEGAAIRYFDVSAARMREAMPVAAPVALAEWHAVAQGSTEAVISALESQQPNEELEALLERWEMSLRTPFPTGTTRRMQAAADGITTCKGAEMTGFALGAVIYGGVDATPAWD